MENNKQKDLENIYRVLVGAGHVINKKDFANKIGADPATISNALKGKEGYLTDKFFNRIYDTFPQLPQLLQQNSHNINIVQADNNGISGSRITGSTVTMGAQTVFEERLKAKDDIIASKDAEIQRLNEIINKLLSK